MKQRIILIIMINLTLVLSACSREQVESSEFDQGAAFLTPYHTRTATGTHTPTLPSSPTETPVPTLTSTPRVYEVKENDTLIWIAYNNGLSLAELQAANPDVNAYTLSKGMQLVLPAPSGLGGTQAPPTPTPAPASVQPPICYRSLTGGLICYALLWNDTENYLQNISAEMRLINDLDGETTTQAVFSPLQVLPPGKRLPLFVSFLPPVNENVRPAIQLLSAVETSIDSLPSLPLVIDELTFTVNTDGTSADVSGIASFSDSELTGKVIRLVAIAYDANGNVAGIRRYEESSPLKAGEVFKFDIKVYSPSSVIDLVEVLGEVQP